MSSWSPASLWRSAGVRARTTGVAVIVVGLVLAVGFVLLADQTRQRLEDSIIDAAETRALDVAALAEAGALPGTILTAGAEQHVQVVRGETVLAATFGLEGFPPVAPIRPAPGESVQSDLPEEVFHEIEERSELIEDESPYILVARGFSAPDGDGTVLVASSIDAASTAVNTLQPLLWIGWPITLAAVGATVWFLTGWAIRPVAAMSAEADSISASDMDRRLPVPGAQDEIHHLARTLNGMLDRLESAAARQRRFVSDASHELKTPLATIRTMLDVAGEPGFDEWQEVLGGLRREGARMEALVGDLLVLARFDEGAAVARRREVDLDQMLGRVAEGMAVRHPLLDVDTAGIEPVRVTGEPASLERLFTNLASNAARHAAGRVGFASRSDRGGAVVLVTDDGPGIPVTERERVFERFVRLDEARDRPEGGTGLGLAVARAIARGHGGEVTVQDGSPGAVLRVWLPAEPDGFSARS
ncbi:MAG: HAMP domain-containing histidine kinase [Acidimicrobiia bacterium]|nr:HAMP domain-containing histidine kinase [Acidimicrobiia bacterium]NNF10843.1 HAMP domain-containing histidine kinase [Acidimicrobiia bacterium]NNL71162.1 HAMP domain-containing histidine kinase [Acidimicrobiia bacterium]